MQIVIDIPEEEYQNYLKMKPAYSEGIKAIQNGIPIDSDILEKQMAMAEDIIDLKLQLIKDHIGIDRGNCPFAMAPLPLNINCNTITCSDCKGIWVEKKRKEIAKEVMAHYNLQEREEPKMSRFWIDYSTSVCIEAETAEDALRQFWNDDKSNEVGSAEIQVDCVEEESEV